MYPSVHLLLHSFPFDSDNAGLAPWRSHKRLMCLRLTCVGDGARQVRIDSSSTADAVVSLFLVLVYMSSTANIET